MTKKYYSIRFEHNDASYKAGEQVFNADNPLYIGQTKSCDILLTNNSQYEDAALCLIEKRIGGQGWKLIRLSPFKEHEVRVNGTPVNYVHFLQNGDRIAFEGQRQELVFNIREDDLYASSGIVRIPAKAGFGMLLGLLLVLALCIGGLFTWQYYNSGITQRMVKQAKASVFKIRVDSIHLVAIDGADTTVLRSCQSLETGTAFLTTDGLLVTARHCIEPWLNIKDSDILDTIGASPNVKMALEAVTRNIISMNTGDTKRWDMITYCSLMKPDKGGNVLLNLTSSDFITDDSRDEIMECGDFSHQYYWRSLSARPRRVDMMLGDIAYFPVAPDMLPDFKGNICPATSQMLKKIETSDKDKSIAVLGFPKVEIASQEMESTQGSIKKSIHFAPDGYPDRVISHGGDLSSGFSGGPVLIKRGFKCYAIGVISVTDKYEKSHFYSVPITEIERMNANQQNVKK